MTLSHNQKVTTDFNTRDKIVHGDIISVKGLLSDSSLTIPTYQRPYKWSVENASLLLNDVMTHTDPERSYRLGTLVLHEEQKKRNIVDGQQRTITLLLIIRALKQRINELENSELGAELEHLNEKLIDPDFSSDVSKSNIQQNYQAIARIVSRPSFTEKHIDFLLNRCEFARFNLTYLSEAFQFFDSKNSRGRDLEPHDLLKAFHLREFHNSEEHLKLKAVEHWENTNTSELSKLFALYLFRIRKWSNGASARKFSKNDIGEFKGVNLNKNLDFPFTKQLMITDRFVISYNHGYEREIDKQEMQYPFQIDGTIINGSRFFEMTAHYLKVQSNLSNQFKDEIHHHERQMFATRILKAINTYSGRKRTGDRYVRALFDCLLMYYIDKYGNHQLSKAIEQCFIWAYSLRLRQHSVRLASVDRHAIEKPYPFKLINESTQPDVFLNLTLPVVPKIRSQKTDKIDKLFREMNYTNFTDSGESA